MIKDDNSKRFVAAPLQRRGKGGGNIGVAVWDEETIPGFFCLNGATLPLRPSGQHRRQSAIGSQIEYGSPWLRRLWQP
jgi:hypothetical protein